MSLTRIKKNRILAMSMVVITLLVVLFSGQLSVQAADSGTNYYVSTKGNDNNNGKSTGKCFRTIKKAVAVAKPGDTVIVSDGTYNEDEIVIEKKAGSSTKRLTLKAANKNKAKVVSKSVYHALTIRNSTGVTVDGLEISFPTTTTSEYHGINAEGNWITIRNCYIHDAPFSGIQGYLCDNLLIENNTIQDNCKGTGKNVHENGSGISVYHPISRQNNKGYHIIIRNNTIYENEATNDVQSTGFPTDGNGIVMDDFHCSQSWDSGITGSKNYPHTSLVENNIVFKNGGRGIHVFSSDNVTVKDNSCWYNGYILDSYVWPGDLTTEDGKYNKFYNNTAISDPGLKRVTAMRVANDGDTTEIKNNIFTGPRIYSSWTTSTGVNTGKNTGNITNSGVIAPKVEEPVKTTTNSALSINASKTTSTITLDGNLDSEWSEKVTSEISKVVTGTADSTSDLSGKFGLLWDNTNLYAMFDITDDSKKNDSDTSWWDDDGVELYIDTINDGGETYGKDDFQYVFRWNDNTVRETKNNATMGVQFVKVDTATGYRIEVKIPWSTLGKTPSVDMVIGIDAGVGDDDDGDSRDAKKMWNSYDDNAWQYPDRFGKCQLK